MMVRGGAKMEGWVFGRGGQNGKAILGSDQSEKSEE